MGRASYESFRPDQLSFRRFFHYRHFKFGKSTNYYFGAIRVEIHFLYNKHGQVGRHMKVLGQINYILEGFFHYGHFKCGKSTNYYFGAIRVGIQFSYYKHGRHRGAK